MNKKNTKFELLYQEIRKLCLNSSFKHLWPHIKEMLEIVEEFEDKPSEELKLAALGHDIERTRQHKIVQKSDFSTLNEYLEAHSKASAEVMGALLLRYGYNESTVEEVKQLIVEHEFGGEGYAQLLCDADSLSFFTYYMPYYTEGKEALKVEQKIIEKYTRISKENRKVLSHKGFGKNLKEVKKYFMQKNN